MQVGIASENDDYDGTVYLRMLELILGTSAAQWDHGLRFSGRESVFKQAPLFLERAMLAGVRLAILAVDNDGGARRRLQHAPEHVEVAQAGDVDGCSFCRLRSAVPEEWRVPGRAAVVVPVQTGETWLICLRDPKALNAPTPEQYYNRAALKRLWFGSGAKPPQSERKALAESALRKPDALSVLRQRESFQLFESQVVAWRTSSI